MSSPTSTSTIAVDVSADDAADGDGVSAARASIVGAAIGALVGALAALAVFTAGTGSVVPAAALVVAGAVAGFDARSNRLPDLGVATMAIFGLAAGGSTELTAWGTGALVAAVPLLVIHLVSPCALGFGDVKFAASLGGLLGIVGADLSDRVRLVMVALTIASGAAVVGAIAVRRRQLPFGPWLFVGVTATLVATALTESAVG